MPDVQIRAAGPSAAPLDYVVPGAHEIDITMLSAHFDGTSASVSWLPCIEIVSDGGTSCGLIPMDSPVAAGASVEATWAPFLRGAQAAAGGATISYAVASGENATLASGGSYKTIGLTSGTFLTNDAGAFAIHAVGGFNGIQVNTKGTYLVSVGTQGFPNAAVAAGAAVGVALLGAGAVNFVNPSEVAPWTQRADGGGYQGNAYQSYIIEVGVAANPVGLTLRVQAGQNTGGTADMSVFVSVAQLDTTNP